VAACRDGEDGAEERLARATLVVGRVGGLEEGFGERTVGFRSDDEDVQDLRTVRDAVDYVEARLG